MILSFSLLIKRRGRKKRDQVTRMIMIRISKLSNNNTLLMKKRSSKIT